MSSLVVERIGVSLDRGFETAASEFEAKYADFVSSMQAVRPETVRGIRLGKVLHHGPWLWWHGRLKDMYRHSEVASNIDMFVSHSWQTPAWKKYLNLLILRNGLPAMVLGTLGASVANVLSQHLILPPLEVLGGGWCLLSGCLIYYLTLLRWRPRTILFWDSACINQHDPLLKAEGLASLGAILKQSKTLLVLWDQTFVSRLWCMFEMAAYLHGRAGSSASVTVRSPLAGVLVLSVHASLCMITFLYFLPADSFFEPSQTMVVIACLALPGILSFSFVISTVRAYWRDIDTMEQHMLSFALDNSKCACCSPEQTDVCNKRVCDRRIMKTCIENWFGQVSSFESRIRSEERIALADKLRNHLIVYFEMVLAGSPLIWSGLELLLRVPPDLQIPMLIKKTVECLAVLPIILKVFSLVTYKLRFRWCSRHLDFCLSVGIAAMGMSMWAMYLVIDFYVIYHFIVNPFAASLTSASVWLLLLLTVWTWIRE